MNKQEMRTFLGMIGAGDGFEMMTEEPKVVAYQYELATTFNKSKDEYSGWRKCISECKPCVPKGSVRNLVELVIKNEN